MKNQGLEVVRPYQDYFSNLTNKFEEIKFTHMSRGKNKFADALANLASMTQINIGGMNQPISIEVRNFQAHIAHFKSHKMRNHGLVTSSNLSRTENTLQKSPR